MKNKYLLDTCTLLWWTLDQDKLSKKAAIACSELLLNPGFISSISIWEVGVKIKNKKIDIGMSIDSYTKKVQQMGCLTIVPVDEDIWIRNLALKWNNKDPADRTIVATAIKNSCHIITADKQISNYYDKSVW